MARVRVVLAMIGCVAALASAQAQTQVYDPEAGITGPFVWNLGGTLAVPLGSQSDRVDTGGGFTVGLTFNPNPVAGVQFEYGANWSSLKTGTLANNGIGGNAFMQYFDLNAVLHPVHAGAISFYLLGGGGLYYRSADVTRVEGTTIAPYCDPWLFYCSAVPVTAVSVIGSRSSWDWGLDAGLGLTFAVAPPVRLYAEVRYHYIFGPSYTSSDGSKRTADGQILPLTLGVRF